MTSSLLLPEGSCLVHIGPYKTGSSSIQAAFHAKRAELREQHGVVYPGKEVRARRAGWGLIGVTPRGRRTATIAAWQALVDEVRAAGNLRVCVSTEDLARVDAEVARRVVQDLGPERVRVLTVVRRLDRLLPSQWQQRAQGFRPEDFDEYLHAVLDRDAPADHPARRPFWASHDVAKVLGTWAGEAGADRVIALVADETDRALLPRTFEGLLGLPAGMLEDFTGSNPSLSYNGVEMIRRLNLLALERGWPDEVYSRYVRKTAHAMKVAGRSEGDLAVPRLPAWAVDRVRELSEERADAVIASGVHVVGDVDSLRAVEGDFEGVGPVATIAIDTVLEAVRGALTADALTLAQVADRAGSTATIDTTSTRELVTLLRGRVAARVGRSGR